MAALAGPLSLVFLGNQLLSTVDAAIVGRYSEVALAATGLGNGIYLTVGVVGLGIMLGLDPMLAEAVGARDHRKARALLIQSGWLALALTVPLTLIMLGLLVGIRGLGLEAELVDQTSLYLVARIPGLFFFLLLTGVRSYLQAYETTRPLVIAIVGANVLNLPLDWLLVFGDDGLVRIGLAPIGMPSLGVVGAGLTSTACTILQVAALWWALAQLGRKHGANDPPRRADRPTLTGAFRLGFPVGSSILADIGALAIVGLAMGMWGTGWMAAFTVCTVWTGVTSQITLAFAITSSIHVAKHHGRRDVVEARDSAMHALGVTAIVMVACGVAFWLFAPWLVSVVTSQADAIGPAVTMMAYAALYPLAEGIKAVTAGALRGRKDTKFPLYANLVGLYGVGLPAGFLLTWLTAGGPNALWWGLCLGLALTGALCLHRFVHGVSSPHSFGAEAEAV